MDDEDGYFGERVAATYNEGADVFGPGDVAATAGVLAELAGMRLRDRWDGWTREPFTSESRQHVSVWEKPA